MLVQTPDEVTAAPVVAAQVEGLEAHLQARLAGRVLGFRLCLRGGGLVLRGRSPTYYAKQLAQHAVMAATALRIVANEIEVMSVRLQAEVIR